MAHEFPEDVWKHILDNAMTRLHDLSIYSLVCKRMNTLAAVCGSINISVNNVIGPAAITRLRRLRNISSVAVSGDSYVHIMAYIHSYAQLYVSSCTITGIMPHHRPHTVSLRACSNDTAQLPTSITDLRLDAHQGIINIGHLTALTKLSLRRNGSFTLPAFTNLQSLSLRSIKLASLPYLPQLHTLKLPAYDLPDTSNINRMTSLTRLRLPMDTRAYVRIDALTNLRDLTTWEYSTQLHYHPLLVSLRLGSSLSSYADIESLQYLRKLKFSEGVTMDGWHIPTWVTKLDLIGPTSHIVSYLNDDYVQRLTNLRSLDLTRNEVITDACVSKLTALTRLRISEHSRVTVDGLAALTALRTLKMRDKWWFNSAALAEKAPWVTLCTTATKHRSRF